MRGIAGKNYPLFMIRLLKAHLMGCCLALLATLISCKPFPTTNTVIVKAESPDGKLSALLVDRFYHAARISDGFFLIVISSTRNADEAVNAQNIGESAALVATRADKVQLRWQDNETLVAICDSCGLEAIDISKELDRIESTKIVYQGFPDRTAYSRTSGVALPR
jgi:hypothetical protein